MSEWMEILKTAGINVGVLLIILWWLTGVLIPQLQKERTEAIAAFSDEAAKDRTMYKESLERIAQNQEKAIDGLLDHIRESHVVGG